MKATLWDGYKQLDGELTLHQKSITFTLFDFELTDLSLEIPYKAISKINYYVLFNLLAGGVEIHSGNGRRNVFVVDQPKELVSQVQKHLDEVISI